MAVTGTYTVLDIVTAALRKCGAVAIDETATADEASVGLMALNMMLKAWQSRRYNLWTKTAMTKLANTSYPFTLSPIRPKRILSVRWKNTSGTEMPMSEMTRDEYDDLPIKTTTGIPTQWYYDNQREAARLYVWPKPLASVTTESFEITYERELTDCVLTDAIDIPGEWWEAAVYGLASRVQTDFQIVNDRIDAKALEALELALADDTEESVYFYADH